MSLQCLHSHLKGLNTGHIKKKVNMWIEMLVIHFGSGREAFKLAIDVHTL